MEEDGDDYTQKTLNKWLGLVWTSTEVREVQTQKDLLPELWRPQVETSEGPAFLGILCICPCGARVPGTCSGSCWVCWEMLPKKWIKDTGQVKQSFIQTLLGVQLGRYRFKMQLNCVPLNDEMEEAYKGKNHRLRRITSLFIENYDWRLPWGKGAY